MSNSLFVSRQSAKGLPDWGKIEFQQYARKPWDEILSGASSTGRDLTKQLVRYESGDRISAVEVCPTHFESTNGQHYGS